MRNRIYGRHISMKIENLKILIAGGAGFIGSHLVDSLVLADNKIVVVDNFTSGKIENLKTHLNNNNVKIVRGDIRDKAFVFEITKGMDVVYNLSVQCLRGSIKNPELNHEVNVTGTLNLCMACLKNKVKRFIYISSSEAYGTALSVPMREEHPLLPTTIYGASKAAGELYTISYHKTYALQSMVLRPFNTYGPRAHFEGIYGEVIPRFVLRFLNDASPVIFGDGTQTRDFTYVSDIVKGMIMASGCDKMIGQAVNIARGQEVSINRLAEIISKKLHKEDIISVYAAGRPGDVRRHCADVRKAEGIFGFTASTAIEDGIERYIEWFMSQGYNCKKLLKQYMAFNW